MNRKNTIEPSSDSEKSNEPSGEQINTVSVQRRIHGSLVDIHNTTKHVSCPEETIAQSIQPKKPNFSNIFVQRRRRSKIDIDRTMKPATPIKVKNLSFISKEDSNRKENKIILFD
jgi:hypothetical protein